MAHGVEHVVQGRFHRWISNLPIFLVAGLSARSFGIIGALVISGIILWLGRWHKVQVAAFWIIIPFLFFALALTQSALRQPAASQAASEAEGSEPARRSAPMATQPDTDARPPKWSDLVAENAQVPVSDASASSSIVWDDQNPQATQPPADNPATWAADVAHVFELHPALQYGQNKAIMQEKLNALGHSGLNYHDMLETAYQQTLNDRRWSMTP